MGTDFISPASGDGIAIDSGNPCDFASVAYDPIACSGAGVDSGDPCDFASVAYDPVACSGGGDGGGLVPSSTGFDPNVDAFTVDWCNSNPGCCDSNGPSITCLGQYCNDNPQGCTQNSDGTLTRPTSSGGAGSAPKPSGGRSIGASGSSAGGILGGISSFLSGLAQGVSQAFSTCPAGYVKSSSGTCVKTGTGTVANHAGILGSLGLGGVSPTTLIVVGIVVLVLLKQKGKI